jgi:nucleoside-diphosphate-sugar epimerase
MTKAARATTFVTGDRFIGTELVKLLVSRGHRVLALTRSTGSAQRARRAGRSPVAGDLLEAGRWQDEQRPTGSSTCHRTRRAGRG